MLFRETVSRGTFQLLERISTLPEFSAFALAGGTALALQIGHRISVDLDFFGNEKVDAFSVLSALRSEVPISLLSQNSFMVVLSIDNIKVDFVNYQYPLLQDLVTENNIKLYSVCDIAAMKLSAIAGRGRKRDFFDLYFLLEKFSLREMLNFYSEKFHDGSELMVIRSLTFFDDAETDEQPKLINQNITWSDVKVRISKDVKDLFNN